jgi:predicted nucleotidyltransferase
MVRLMQAKLHALPVSCAPIAERLTKVLELIVERYEPEQIILFGSYAYGTPRRDSDVDLLIVKEADADPHQRALAVRRCFAEARNGVSFSILVRTPGELAERLRLRDPFFAEIVNKGVVLHETT